MAHDPHQKRDAMLSRLKSRHEERIARDPTAEDGPDRDNRKFVSFFLDSFRSTRITLEEKLALSDQMKAENVGEHFDDMFVELQKLQKFTTESVQFLPSYEVRRAQEELKALQDSLVQKKDELIPKRKFAFKGRKKEDNAAKANNIGANPTDEVDDASGGTPLELKYSGFDYGFNDRIGERLSLNPGDVNGKDVGLLRLKDCRIDIRGYPGTVHICNLENCLVVAGPIQTSVFVEACKGCIIVIGCQQLRMHTTTRSDLYLHVGSNPIVEDCSEIRFAPYSLTYPDVEKHFESASLDRDLNYWKAVKDFNWLAADVPSPNWSIIPEQEWKLNWD